VEDRQCCCWPCMPPPPGASVLSAAPCVVLRGERRCQSTRGEAACHYLSCAVLCNTHIPALCTTLHACMAASYRSMRTTTSQQQS
jgi:hypothetical protein